MKTRYLILILGLITAAGWSFLRAEPASAAFNMYGRTSDRGYYSNQNYQATYVFLDTGASGINYNGIKAKNANMFIDEMKARLYSPVEFDTARASATLNMMMGIQANDARYNAPSADRWRNGVAYARANFAAWESRVRDYDAAGRVEWNDIYSSTTAPMDWMGAGGSITDPQYPDIVPHQLPGIFDNTPAVIFYNPNGTSFTIVKTCANLTGEVEPLQDLTPPTVLSCGTVGIQPQKPELGDSVVVTPTVRYSAGPPGSPMLGANSIDVRNSSGRPGTIAGTAVAGAGIIRLTSSSFTVPEAGQYTVRWSVTANGTSITCGGLFSSNDSFVVMSYPFIQVNGGDAVAGASFSTPGATSAVPCSSAPHNQNAGIASSNRNTQPDYTGAGGKYAVMALNVIQSFASDQGKGRDASSLAFSNIEYADDGKVSVQQSSGRFGGLFGTAPCVDYWGTKPANSQLQTLAAGANLNGMDGEYKFTGNLTIGNTLLQSGKQLTIYVTGDVNITRDIVFQNNATSYTDTTDIPVFKLIVNGRIFIDNTVNQLDGVYVAVPNSNYVTAPSSFAVPAAGTISTCSNGFTSYNPMQAATNNMISRCDRSLTVNGSFIANQLFLLRTYGAVGTNQPAEIFNYTPELWLTPSDVSINDTYDSMAGLPPIL